MKKLAIIALCLFSSFASANNIEEVVVKARHIRIFLIHIAENHVQNPVTKNWHYVAERKQSEDKA